MSTLPEYIKHLLEDATGKKAKQWTVPDCGLSAALRFSVQLEDNSRVFIKAATDEYTEQWLRNEYLVLSSIKEKCMPSVIDWLDKPGAHPVLITQDLSDAYWPASHEGVTWREGDVALLFEGLKELSSLKAIPALPALQKRKDSLWSEIAGSPAAFLDLGLCSERWLNKSVDALIKAEMDLDITGDQLVHGDIRSDNVCFKGSQAIFVDWSHAARGNADHDLASLLPTLYLEGGPAPYTLMPEGESEAASGSAVLIQRTVSDHLMPHWLKDVFGKLISIELEWAADCLGLEYPDGKCS